MTAEKVNVLLGHEIECSVWIVCSQDISENEKQERALQKLKIMIEQKEKLAESFKKTV